MGGVDCMSRMFVPTYIHTHLLHMCIPFADFFFFFGVPLTRYIGASLVSSHRLEILCLARAGCLFLLFLPFFPSLLSR